MRRAPSLESGAPPTQLSGGSTEGLGATSTVTAKACSGWLLPFRTSSAMGSTTPRLSKSRGSDDESSSIQRRCAQYQRRRAPEPRNQRALKTRSGPDGAPHAQPHTVEPAQPRWHGYINAVASAQPPWEAHRASTVNQGSVRAPENLQEEQEDVQDIEKDARGKRDRLVGTGMTQAVEVRDRIHPEDGQAGE